MGSKRTEGNFFEDFVVGKTIHHAVPRTVTDGDLALYIALTGDRRPLHCSRESEVNSGADDAPELPRQVAVHNLHVPSELDLANYDPEITASRFFWEDYEPGERILHPQGLTIENAEHQMATRLYQNNARVHFNELLQKKSRLGTRIIYGGHIISLAHAISNDGLENVIRI